jgi:signal transduction histidine kinase
LGLGLSKVWRIMELHGGQIVVESRDGEGTTFTLAFPPDHRAGSVADSSR